MRVDGKAEASVMCVAPGGCEVAVWFRKSALISFSCDMKKSSPELGSTSLRQPSASACCGSPASALTGRWSEAAQCLLPTRQGHGPPAPFSHAGRKTTLKSLVCCESGHSTSRLLLDSPSGNHQVFLQVGLSFFYWCYRI